MTNTDRIATLEADPIFGVVTQPQTYLNILYLLLAFPLGVFYFVLLVTGFSLGAGLVIVWVGLPILVGVLVLAVALGAFERELANRLLSLRIPSGPVSHFEGSRWKRARAFLRQPHTWTSVLYLLTKFVLGFFSFSFLVGMLATSLGMMATPLLYEQSWWDITIPGVWSVDTFSKAVATSVLGAVLGVASLHLSNWLAFVYGRYTTAMLSREPAESCDFTAAQR